MTNDSELPKGSRIAGMTIDADGIAALAVLVREGEQWRVEWSGTVEIRGAVIAGGGYVMRAPGCPIVLDAGAFTKRPTAYVDGDKPPVGVMESIADRILAAGWDVRPPLWRDGRAANPDRQRLRQIAHDLGLWVHNCKPPDVVDAIRLAAWGATQETLGEPPVPFFPVPDTTHLDEQVRGLAEPPVHHDRGPGATHSEDEACCREAPVILGTGPNVRRIDSTAQLAYALTVMGKPATPADVAHLFEPQPITAIPIAPPGPADCPECHEPVGIPGVVHRLPCSRATTKAERLLVAMVEVTDGLWEVDSSKAWENARAYLVERGLILEDA